MHQRLQHWLICLSLILLIVSCGEPVPVDCTPDEEQCTTETEGGFETGPVAGIAAGGAAVVAIAAGGLGGGKGGGSYSSSSSEASNTNQNTPTQTGILLDSAVGGVSYKTSSNLYGLTNTNGQFQYRIGDEVTFTVGETVLGEVKGGELITPVELAGTNNTADRRVINISRLLQSLDQDGDPFNGISISPTTLSLLGQQAFEFDLPVTEFQLQVNPFIENIFNRPIVDAGEAINHLHSSLNLEGRPGSIGSQDEIRLLVPGFVTVTLTNELSEPPTTSTQINCNFAGGTVPDGGSVIAYQSSNVAAGQLCSSQTRFCNNGLLSGSYAYMTCQVQEASDCKLNGNSIANGNSVTTYQSLTVPFGQSCQSELRLCINGALSGTYLFQSCSEAEPTSCAFNGADVPHGGVVNAFLEDSVSSEGSCNSQVRSCFNGVLSGTYAHESCTVQQAQGCGFNGQTIDSGQSVTAYHSNSVPFGSNCISETRSCDNGFLSGSYAYNFCSIREAASCEFGNQTIFSGDSVSAFKTQTVPKDSNCIQQTRICTNGTLSGNYLFESCYVESDLDVSQNTKLTVKNLSSSNSGNFVISNNTNSFLLSAFSSGTARITRLVSPSGRDELAYLESTASGLTSFGDGPYENYLVPMRPDIDAEAGTWTYQITGASEVKLTVREDEPSAIGEPSLLVQPYLASGESYNLETVWQLVRGLYTNNSLNVTIGQTINIREEQYRTVSDSFFDSETQALITQGRADAVNIFLVDEVEGGGVLGIAAGIPGSLGIQGPHNGVLVSLGSHLSGPFFNQSINDQLLAETIVHEAGHLLGLWHPTEDNGVEFDPLDDTPECRKSVYDSNNNGQVSAEECVGNGAENIMFWASWGGGDQNQFTEDQRTILRQSPLAFKGETQASQTGDGITLTYSTELSSTVTSQASTLASVQDYVELMPECQKSSTPQSIDLILAQGCINFQDIHYRPAYLPNNLDGLVQIDDYVNVVRQNDRFSYYFEPVAFSENTQALSGGRSYIGFSYQVNNSNAVISDNNPFLLGSVFPFTRAWWDGLQAGDRLIAVDGIQISGLTVENIRDLLPRTEAATSTLTLLRNGNQIQVQTASETHLSRSLGSTNQIAYLNLREYTTVSADRIRDDYTSLISAGSGGTGGVILDLRQNGGGSLSGAWNLTDFLGPSSVDNQITFSLKQQSQGFDYRFGVYGSNLGITDPSKFVILIDGSSASASELTSAALKDLEIATLMGGITYGKGVGQNVVGLLDGSGVYITSFELLSPLGNSWHNLGVSPDYPLSTALPATPADDTLLQAAIDFIETGSVSQATTSRRTTKSPLLLSVPPYSHPWDGGSRQRLN